MFYFDIYYDKSVTIISVAIIILIISLSILFYILSEKKINFLLVAISLSMYIPIFLALIYAPRNYVVDNNCITINRIVGKIEVCKEEIINCIEVNPTDLGSLERTFASGGLFGYFGTFSSEKKGNLKMYSGSLNNKLILISLKKNEQILLSPQDTKKFIVSLQTNLSR